MKIKKQIQKFVAQFVVLGLFSVVVCSSNNSIKATSSTITLEASMENKVSEVPAATFEVNVQFNGDGQKWLKALLKALPDDENTRQNYIQNYIKNNYKLERYKITTSSDDISPKEDSGNIESLTIDTAYKITNVEPSDNELIVTIKVTKPSYFDSSDGEVTAVPYYYRFSRKTVPTDYKTDYNYHVEDPFEIYVELDKVKTSSVTGSET